MIEKCTLCKKSHLQVPSYGAVITVSQVQLIQSFFFLLYLPVSHCWSFNLRPWERTNISSYISSYSSSQSRSPLLFLRFFRQPFLHFIFLCVDFVCCFCIFLSSCVFFLYTLESSSSVWIELMVIDWTLKTLIKIIFKYIYNVVLFIFNIF